VKRIQVIPNETPLIFILLRAIPEAMTNARINMVCAIEGCSGLPLPIITVLIQSKFIDLKLGLITSGKDTKYIL
jgi:hypothetical protein